MGHAKEQFMQEREGLRLVEEQANLELVSFKEDDINITKSGIEQRAKQVELDVLDGFLDPLEMLIRAKKIQEFGKAVEAKVRPIAEDKVRLAKGEVYSKFSVAVSQKVNGASTDYSACGDPEWNSLSSQLEKLKAEIKEREKFLSGITRPLQCFDEETGDTWTIQPPIKSGKLGLSLSIK